MIRTIQRVVLCVSVLVASAGQVYAGFVTYTDKTSFMAALASSSTDNFNDLSLGFQTTPITRIVGSYTYQLAAAGGFFNVGTASDVWLSANNSFLTPINFTISGGGPTAIGGFFFATDATGLLASSTISASINGGLFTQSVTTSSATNFFGWVSTDGTQISSLSVVPSAFFATANDLIIGQANIAAVPEPTSLALFGIGACVAGFGAARRQQRDNKKDTTV